MVFGLQYSYPLARVTKYACEATAPEFRRVANIERWLSLHKHRKMYMKLVERGVSVERLRSMFEYRDGKVFRLVSSTNGQARCAKGTQAGSLSECVKGIRYRTIRIDGKHFNEHRIIWALVTGVWPSGEIDHKDYNHHNNAIDNLRDTTRSGNMQNLGRRSTNTSGVTGVNWSNSHGKWEACICVQYKRIKLGRFDALAEAAKARKAAEEFYGFHQLHGTCREYVRNHHRNTR